MWKCSNCGERVEDDFEVCWSCGTTRDGVRDPHFFDHDAAVAAPENQPLPRLGGETDDEPEPMVTVARCNLLAEAHAMRMHLEAAGIPVFLADELTVAMDWLLSNAIGGVKVQVPEQYAERAAQLLDQFPRPGTSDEAD
jgi:hypothetical protein